jgi:hypothetical protein
VVVCQVLGADGDDLDGAGKEWQVGWPTAGGSLSAIDRAERQEALQNIYDRLLAATVAEHLPTTGAYALDDSGIRCPGQTPTTLGRHRPRRIRE